MSMPGTIEGGDNDNLLSQVGLGWMHTLDQTLARVSKFLSDQAGAEANMFDPNLLLRAAASCSPKCLRKHKKLHIPGGFLGVMLTMTEYGVNARHVLLKTMARKGVHVPKELRRGQGSSRPLRPAAFTKLCARLTVDVPAYISRLLISRGDLGGLYQSVFLTALTRFGLHKRGVDLVKGVMCATASESFLKTTFLYHPIRYTIL